jgi:hypothetical protein
MVIWHVGVWLGVIANGPSGVNSWMGRCYCSWGYYSRGQWAVTVAGVPACPDSEMHWSGLVL